MLEKKEKEKRRRRRRRRILSRTRLPLAGSKNTMIFVVVHYVLNFRSWTLFSNFG